MIKEHAWFLEMVQDYNGTYYANMTLGGKKVEGLPEHVDYNTLKDAIRQKTGVCILNRNEMIFQQSGKKKYAFIDATQPRKDCRVTLEEIRNGWKPDFGSVDTPKETRQPTAVDDLLSHDSKFRYMLLDRMRSDCEYYLGNGNRCSKHLWAGNEKEQIACMKALWNSFPAGEKPEWLTPEKIADYEKKMVLEKPPLSQQIVSASLRTGTEAAGPNQQIRESSIERS